MDSRSRSNFLCVNTVGCNAAGGFEATARFLRVVRVVIFPVSFRTGVAISSLYLTLRINGFGEVQS